VHGCTHSHIPACSQPCPYLAPVSGHKAIHLALKSDACINTEISNSGPLKTASLPYRTCSVHVHFHKQPSSFCNTKMNISFRIWAMHLHLLNTRIIPHFRLRLVFLFLVSSGNATQSHTTLSLSLAQADGVRWRHITHSTRRHFPSACGWRGAHFMRWYYIVEHTSI